MPKKFTCSYGESPPPPGKAPPPLKYVFGILGRTIGPEPNEGTKNVADFGPKSMKKAHRFRKNEEKKRI